MLDSKAFYRPNIFVFSGTQKEHAKEEFVREHVLCHVIAGELRFTEADKDTIARAGETILFRRDLLVKCEKRPLPDGQPFQIVYFIIERNFLQRFAVRQGFKRTRPRRKHAQVVKLEPRPALAGLLKSISPYIETGMVISKAMLQHKLEEAILALSEQQEKMIPWLFDLEEQEKVDLADFMTRNYMFNIPMTKFAELTGRSLSTFQRDFKKIFGVNAAKWLLKRRLQAAYDAIRMEKKMPSDIYLDLGFEDLSHFSRSFKSEFGVNASEVRALEAVR